MSTVTRTETRKRGFFGWMFLILFWLFNALMLAMLIVGSQGIAEVSETAVTEAEQAGVAIGAALGVGMILSIWVLGDIILGAFVLMTRGRKITIETTSD